MRSSPSVAAALLVLGCSGTSNGGGSGSGPGSDGGSASTRDGSSLGSDGSSDAGWAHACDCDAGPCLVTLASVPTGAHALAVNGANLYFLTECVTWSQSTGCTGSGAVLSVPVCGGTPTTLWHWTPTGGITGSLAASSGSVFWTYSDLYGVSPQADGPVMAIPEGGGTATTLATGQPVNEMGDGMAANASAVYWNEDFCMGGECGLGGTPHGALMWAPVGGGDGGVLATDPGGFSGVGLDDANVYWANTLQGTVVKVPLAGGAETTLATGQTHPSYLIAAAGNVYWANVAPTQAALSDIVTLPVSGGTPVTLASNQPDPRGLAADGANVYWANSDGTIMKVPRSGGALVTLASGQATQGFPRDVIAVDATSVYWATTQGIMKLTPK